jgi:predicted AAA+ superfamily ATPase
MREIHIIAINTAAPALSDKYPELMAAWNRYIRHGGMPALTHPEFSDTDRIQWCVDYTRTYLQRDLVDLTRANDLEPFAAAEKLLANRNCSLIIFSDIARSVSVSPNTINRYLQYLEISYQTLKLPAWHRNREKRLAKMPKVLFLDPGITRALTGIRGELSGREFEAAVLGEIIKQIRSAQLPATFYHLRTSDQRGIDLLIEFPQGFIAIEVKQTSRAAPTDARHLHGLDSILDKPFLAGMLISNDLEIRCSSELKTLFFPAAFILGAGKNV